MNPNASVQRLAEHYAKLLGIPGWSEYAQERIAKLSQTMPQLFGDLPRLVREVRGE